MPQYIIKTEAPNPKKSEDKWSASWSGALTRATFGKTERQAVTKLIDVLLPRR